MTYKTQREKIFKNTKKTFKNLGKIIAIILFCLKNQNLSLYDRKKNLTINNSN